MADVHSKEIRSKNMTAIKCKSTKPEMLCMKIPLCKAALNKYKYYKMAFAGRKQGKTAEHRVFLDFLFLLSTAEECIKAKERAKQQ